MSGPLAVAAVNQSRSIARALFAGTLRDRLAGWAGLLSAVGFAALEVAGLRAGLDVATKALVQVPSLRPDYLVEKLLATAFAAAAFLLVLGTLTTAVSMLFLSEELTARLPLPVPHRTLFLRQVLIAIATSSAPTLLIALPAFGVAAAAARRPVIAFAVATLAFLAVVLLAGLFGTVIALLLVQVIPPRRARLLAAFLSAIGLAAALLGFRTARPERLLDPFEALAALRALGESAPAPAGANPVLLAAHAASSALFDRPGALVTSTALFAAALVIVFGASAALAGTHLAVFRKTRESGSDTATPAGRRRPVRSLGRMLVRAEMRTLFRDAATPAQLGSLAAVFVLDLLNVRLLPIADAASRNLLAGLQTGLALFLVSALSLRFAYPSVSSDGRAALVLRTLPLSPARHLAARYAVRGLPAVVIALVLIGASDLVLRPGREVVLTSLAVGVLGGLALPALNLGLGALFPRYGAENAVAVALGPGGLFALVLSTALSLASTVVVSEELRLLVAAALSFELPRAALLPVWTLLALASGALPLIRATRSLSRSDLGAS